MFSIAVKITLVSLFFSQKILIAGDSEACAMKFGAIKSVQDSSEKIDVDCTVGSRVGQWDGGRIRRALSRDQYDYVIVFLGANDYGSKPNPSGIVKSITDSGAKCIWVGPPLIRGQKSVTNDHLKKSVSPNCTYVDTQALSIPLVDGIHPTTSGALKWLKKIWEIKNSLKKSQP